MEDARISTGFSKDENDQ
jgi:hypothetical protein